MKKSEEYTMLLKQLRALTTLTYIRKMESRIDKHYTIGTISESEYKKLDLIVFDKLVGLSI